VLEESVIPDLPRLFDEARVDFILAHLASEAGSVVGDELVEIGRFQGLFVRAVARTSRGSAVAAIVVPKDQPSTAALENELAEIRTAMGPRVVKLVYGISSNPRHPVQVERVPEGELL
jgi:hypothetical protein